MFRPAPGSMRWTTLLSAFLAALALGTSACGQAADEEESETLRGSGGGDSAQTPELGKTVQLLVEQANQFRQKEGRQTVNADQALTETATYFANYMAKTDKYGHTADGKRPSERAKSHGYQYCIVSENIAYQYSSAGFTTDELARRFVEGWEQSPEHRKNMLDRDVNETGVAVAHSEQSGHYYAVQMFGRPKSKSIAFEIANQSPAAIQYQIGERKFPLPPHYTRTHQRCRPAEVTFFLAGMDKDQAAKSKTKAVKPDPGDRFVITEKQGEIRVQEQ